ncbi:MAG TPA: hypothetical protein GXZ26_04910 [Firmicutes bacterium]|nr:hypothetical protein [Bacillota bacterium]
MVARLRFYCGGPEDFRRYREQAPGGKFSPPEHGRSLAITGDDCCFGPVAEAEV